MSFFWCIKPTEQNGYAVGANSCAPTFTAFEFRYAQQTTGFVSCVCPSLILNIFSSGYVTKIIESIVTRIAINVINVSCRPKAGNVKPSQPTSPVSSFVYPNGHVSFWLGVTSNSPRNDFSTRLYLPSEKSGFGTVVQQSTQLVKCDVGMSHAISLT
mgnify:CR=1